jgi:8-oxo-dGTP diphosphatase
MRAKTRRKPVTPLLTVDCVALDPDGRVLLIRRGNPPFAGRHALPGGFVDVGETVEDACRRELLEETGVVARKLTLIGVYSDPARDPRGHSVAAAFLARVGRQEPRAGDDASAAQWVDRWRGLELAFDHARILADAMRLARPTGRPRTGGRPRAAVRSRASGRGRSHPS